MSIIFIDNRENAFDRSNSKKQSPVNFFQKKIDKNNSKHGDQNISHIVTMLTTGDYLISLHGNLKIAIERKTWKDLSGSIVDRRINQQIRNMLELRTKFDVKPIILIEGNSFYQDSTKVGGKHGLLFSQLHSKLRRDLLRHDIAWVHSKDPEHTAEIVVNFARDLLILEKNGEIVSHGVDQTPSTDYIEYLRKLKQVTDEFLKLESEDVNLKYTAEFINENILVDLEFVRQSDEISDFSEISKILKTAGDEKSILPVECTARHESTDEDVIENIWCCVAGISTKSYESIKSKMALSEIISLDKKSELGLSEIQYPGSGRKIGKVSASKIAKNAKLDSTHVKMLSCVPMVSKSVAEKILSEYSITQIMQGEATTEMLANITRGDKSNRKVGKKLAEKIVNLIGEK